jgi:hypothetical protein
MLSQMQGIIIVNSFIVIHLVTIDITITTLIMTTISLIVNTDVPMLLSKSWPLDIIESSDKF